MKVSIRRAQLHEIHDIALFYRATSEREWPFLYPHTPQEDQQLFRTAFDKGPLWLAEDSGGLVGFCAARRGWIDHLYVLHERHGEGIGQALLERALEGRIRVLLWTFQRNARTRAFYRQQGFAEVMFTDGRANEEMEPDVLLEWRKR